MASDVDVRTEIWTSFASLLKVYAAAASLHGIEHLVLDLAENSVNVLAGSITLNVAYLAESGRGIWSFTRDGIEEFAGAFGLNPEGTLSLDGEIQDLDHAAIHLIARLTQSAREGL